MERLTELLPLVTTWQGWLTILAIAFVMLMAYAQGSLDRETKRDREALADQQRAEDEERHRTD